jgi:lysophospholipase L1-like esterase
VPGISNALLRRSLLAVLVVLAALASFKAVLMVSRPRQGDVVRGQWNYVEQERAQILASRNSPREVVLFGDSQIAYSRFEDLGYANYGIGGEIAEGLASRIPAYDLSRARTIVIEVGINNWWHGGFDGFRQAYVDILAGLPRGARVIAIGILPLNSKAGRYFPLEGSQATIRQANADIASVCRLRPGCEFLELSGALGGPAGLRPQYDNGDGLHLSPAGYAVLLEKLRPLLAARSE